MRLHQMQSLLTVLPAVMDGVKEALWNSPLPRARGPQLCKLGGPGKEHFSRLSPRLKHPC